MREIDKKLIDAAKKGDFEMIKKCISEGAEVNAKDEDGGCALLYVMSHIVDLGMKDDRVIDEETVKRIDEAEKQNIGIIKFLIDKKADVNIKDKYGFSLFDNPARWGLKRTLELFVNAGAKDLNHALIIAAGGYPFNVDAVKVLLNAGADINFKYEQNGWTPLIFAAGAGNLELVKFLVESGADIFAKSNNGKSAMSNAKSVHYFHEEVYNYLKERMKKTKAGKTDEIHAPKNERKRN